MLRYPGRLALTSYRSGAFSETPRMEAAPVYLGIKQFFKMSMDTGQSEKQINQDDLMPFSLQRFVDLTTTAQGHITLCADAAC